MRVLVLDTLIDQTIKHKIPNNVLPRLHKEYRELARLEKEGYNAIYTYLTTGNNGKQMHGVTDITIYKFQLTDGDRILYTYGKYLPYLHNEKDSLVLLGYSNHDDQGFIAKHKKFKGNSHSYKYLNNIVRELNNVCEEEENLPEEDLYEIAALIISESFKGYAYTNEELQQFSADEIEKHLLLSEEQEQVISEFQSENSPTLIMGGAGTGKTLIAVHMLSNLATQEDDCSIAYFTQSKILLDKVQKQYNQLKDNSIENPNNIIDFWDINKFCLNLIDVKENQLVNTKRFIEEFIKGYLKQSITGKKLIERISKNNISFDNIWTEIRGTLKGGMQNWTRTNPMSQDNVSFNISKYEKLGYIERLNYNKKLFVLKDSIAKTILKMNKDELENDDRKVIHSIVKYFSNFNSDLRVIDDSYYLSLSDENSLLTKEQRQLVLDIYREYEFYLQRNNLYDENDIVRMVIKSGYHKNNLYDFIFVDEVQDYTELQIYLIYELAKNKNTLVFAGDIHQIINPTLFSISKLKELFRDNKNTEPLKTKPLNTNFRCQKGIVDLANKISNLRRTVIGSQAIEVEQPEKSNVSICLYDPYRLDYSEQNIKDMMLEIIKYPQVVVLVPDTVTKEYLLNFTKDFERPDFIFTVDEIKGMEYDYIICFNLISHYYDIWNRITTQNIKSERTRYRFYFNLLYVAITRSRKHLCFIDNNTVQILEESLNLKPEEKFDAELLHFSELDASIDSWLTQAHEYKQQGRYAIALQFYTQIKDYADINDIYDCHIGIADEDYNYELAISYCILKYANTNAQSDLERIQYYSKQLDKSNNLYKLAEFLLENTTSSKDLAKLIDVAFKNFNDEEKDSISNLFLNRVEELMFDKISNKRIPQIERMGYYDRT